MNMIKEDYVSFEIAKLLKEKGFDCGCDMYYTEIGSVKYTQLKYNHNEIKNRYSRPTHQMATKWLREVHDVFIKIDMIQDGMYDIINDFVYKEPIFQYEIIGINGNDAYKLRGGFNLYEEAVEAAIKYCLENLI